MATYSAAARNTLAAALAQLLGGSRLFVLSATGRTLAVFAVPSFTSTVPGVLETGAWSREIVMASGMPDRWEIRQASGLVLMSGTSAELRITPPELVQDGNVFVDGMTLTV